MAIIGEARGWLRDTLDALTPFVEKLAALPNHNERTIVTFLDHKDFWKDATRFYGNLSSDSN